MFHGVIGAVPFAVADRNVSEGGCGARPQLAKRVVVEVAGDFQGSLYVARAHASR